MFEVKDPKIKLFGKTIELLETYTTVAAGAAFETVGEDASNQDPPSSSSDSMLEDGNFNGDLEDQESGKKNISGTNEKENTRAQPLISEGPKKSNVTPPLNEVSKALSTDSDVGPMKNSKGEEDQNESSNSHDKILKKPDKIIPCPRCNSMDTKFCYFNNYNVSQPRHFCKNCQRYWTAGGTMRNVPVGAGRRKNKNVSQFRHLTVPEALQGNGILNPNGTVLTFSSDAPLCESMASGLNIADNKGRNFSRNGFHQPESKENGDDHSNGSTVTGPSPKDLPQTMPTCHPFPPQLPLFPGAPWPYPWNLSPPPAYGPSGIAVPFYPTGPPPPPYWGCALPPGPWNVPWVIPPTPTSSGPISPTLGKHSREDDLLKEENMVKESNGSEKCLWIPKTLRIDDPGEAAKSSIWKTLGINNDGLFRAFQSQSKDDHEEAAQDEDTAPVLAINPAALSRSFTFQETS